jgi:hypothetical protein
MNSLKLWEIQELERCNFVGGGGGDDCIKVVGLSSKKQLVPQLRNEKCACFDQAQSCYRSNSQITSHIFGLYFREEDDGTEVSSCAL